MGRSVAHLQAPKKERKDTPDQGYAQIYGTPLESSPRSYVLEVSTSRSTMTMMQLLSKTTALPRRGEPPECYDSWIGVIILLNMDENWFVELARQQVMVRVEAERACENCLDIRIRIKLDSPPQSHRGHRASRSLPLS